MEELVGTNRRTRRGCESIGVQPVPVTLVCALLLLQCMCQPKSDSLNATLPADVAALRAFQKAVSDPGGRLHSWHPGVDPCGAPDCSLGDTTNTPQGWHNTPSAGAPVKHNSTGTPFCNYFGVACQQWRVERLVLSCSGVDIACAALQGSLVEDVANLTELRVLDLENNQFRSTIPEPLGHLTKLEVLRLGFNRFYGDMSPKWTGMTALRALDVRSNTLTGVLPSAWGAFDDLNMLHVDHNSLSGFLPASLGNLHELRILSLGNTAIVGALPASWANMTNLQSLDVSNNCGICGNLPMFAPSVLARLQVDSQGSGLGWACTKNTCAAFPISILAQAVICMSIVGGLIMLCLVRRLLYHYYPGLIILSPTAMYQHRQRGSGQAGRNAQELAQQSSEMEAGNAPGNKRASAVFMNPDSTYSYALKEEELPPAEQCPRDSQQAETSSSVMAPIVQLPVHQVSPVEEGSRTSTVADQSSQTRPTGQ